MKVTILQWNINEKENPRKIADKVKRINPDIFCGQEFIQHFGKIPKVDIPKEMAETLGYNYYFESGDTWDTKEHKQTQGNVIMSKFPIMSSTHKHVQEPKHNPPNAEYEGRVYVEAQIKIEENILTVGTVHLSFTSNLEITQHRKKEVDTLVEIIKGKNANYVLAADLNSPPNSYTIKELEKYLVNAGPSYEQNTFPSRPFNYRGHEEKVMNWRPDYVFVSEDISVVSSEILETELSDHLPILVEFQI
jgi:endonuclease/exonuclease/phosphatase family metal-dependent hydrolase